MNQSFIAALFVTFVVGLATAGCPRGDDPIVVPGSGVAAGQGAPITIEAGKPAAEPAVAEPAAKVAEPASEPAADEARPPKMVRRAVVISVEVVRVDAETAEDGRGATVAAATPVAIDIAAEEWPARALDPVLHVGNLEFRHYTFPRVNVLRYVVADPALLTAGAAAWVQYGDDDASRVEVAKSLEVPR